MKAPKMSHTVGLAKPESAQARAALAGLKPGLARSAEPYSTQGARTVARVTPRRLTAGPGSGSTIRPTITPAKMAKKYHACGARPAGAGMTAMASATATGSRAFQSTRRRGFVFGSSGARGPGVDCGAAGVCGPLMTCSSCSAGNGAAEDRPVPALGADGGYAAMERGVAATMDG